MIIFTHPYSLSLSLSAPCFLINWSLSALFYRERVFGWPPVRSYRRQTLSKPVEMFVKVNMDGIAVGRKLDLNAYSSYEGLLHALEDMFQPSNNGKLNHSPPSQEIERKIRCLLLLLLHMSFCKWWLVRCGLLRHKARCVSWIFLGY